MLKLSSTVWRDFETSGVPASGIHKPVKRDIRAWGAYVESLASGAQVGGAVDASNKVGFSRRSESARLAFRNVIASSFDAMV